MFTYPVKEPRIRGNKLSNTFGMVRKNSNGEDRPHQGWDFAALNGTPCFSVGLATVEYVRDGGDYGRQVVLKLANLVEIRGVKTQVWARYAHMSSVSVSAGEKLLPGRQIGLSGSTGNAAGMSPAHQHLHFEVLTEPWPGSGLDGRVSPLILFGNEITRACT